ncbi:MAG: hypothetical protein J7621_14215, partial [Niastella sp.]|nr:hypothetical protein [Niastella sp.]
TEKELLVKANRFPPSNAFFSTVAAICQNAERLRLLKEKLIKYRQEHSQQQQFDKLAMLHLLALDSYPIRILQNRALQD